MKKRISFIIALMLICLVSFNISCKKFLDAKSRQSLAIPETLFDFQALMNQHIVMLENDPSAGELSSDDYYLTTADWNARSESHRRIYTWEKDYLFVPGGNDWLYLYRALYRANSVLDKIDEVPITAMNSFEWADIKGQAYFFRAKGFLQAAIIWAPFYKAATASTDLGLPLRVNSDFNQPSIRSSVKDTYDQILNDAKQAAILLPQHVVHPVRPNKAAAYALVARTYLAMGRYDSCYKYTLLALQLQSSLFDFNSLNPNASFPFSNYLYERNVEILHNSYMNNPAPLSNVRGKIDSILYQSYADTDLRKVVFFRNNNNGTYGFKGSYQGSTVPFSGLATNELYLMKAECLARAGNKVEAMNTINYLLGYRYKAGFFTPLVSATTEDALEIILWERRKELVFRGLRWMDLKRLNAEGRGIVLKRILDNNEYTLLPGALRYALPIPEDVIELSGMQQNPR